jgi:hypothetical protein
MSNLNASPDTGNTSKPDIAANSIYPALARATLFELHANLLDLIRKGLSSLKGPKNLVVVGPGSEALPYSENLESLASLLDDGNLFCWTTTRKSVMEFPLISKAGGLPAVSK